jgi:hypothetical protein
MKKQFSFPKRLLFIAIIFTTAFLVSSCSQISTQTAAVDKMDSMAMDEKPDYYNFRPALEPRTMEAEPELEWLGKSLKMAQ